MEKHRGVPLRPDPPGPPSQAVKWPCRTGPHKTISKMYYAHIWHIDNANKQTQKFLCGRSKEILQAATIRYARSRSRHLEFVRGFWSVNDTQGRALSACTFDRPTSGRWNRVPEPALHFYDLSPSGLNRADRFAKKI